MCDWTMCFVWISVLLYPEHFDTFLEQCSQETDICALHCEKKCANHELCKSGECAEDTANDAFFCLVVLPHHLGKKLALGRQKAEGTSKERGMYKEEDMRVLCQQQQQCLNSSMYVGWKNSSAILKAG